MAVPLTGAELLVSELRRLGVEWISTLSIDRSINEAFCAAANRGRSKAVKVLVTP